LELIDQRPAGFTPRWQRSKGTTSKNAANDAAAISEAASHLHMPMLYVSYVPIKTIEQQSMLCIHRLREGFQQERTACTNRIRELLSEFGLVFAQTVISLRQALPDVIEDTSNELGALARLALQRAQAQ
jgi:transposase